jgi:hypothetical protein
MGSNLIPTYANHQTARRFSRKPAGMLAEVTDTLAEAKINIYAITTSDTVDHSVIRLVVSDYRRLSMSSKSAERWWWRMTF